MALIDPWIDAELRNWASWCWTGPWPHPMPPDHAASAEGRYRAPSDLGDVAPPRPVRPDIRRAEIVHRVYREQLTTREQRVLVLRYVRRVPADQVPRAMRVSQAIVTEALIAASRCIGDSLRESHALRT